MVTSKIKVSTHMSKKIPKDPVQASEDSATQTQPPNDGEDQLQI